MDSTTTIIGVLIVFIIVLPIVAIQRSQTSKKKKSRKGFINEALQNNVTIDQPDFWGSYYAIALDTDQNKLIYSKIINEVYNTKIIELNQVRSCAIVRTNRTFKNKNTFKTETDKIDLVIEYKTTNKPKEVLEFYNVDVNIEMSNEVSLLEKWETKIKSNILQKEQAA
ncbi:hypothetical protein KO494_12355 [Lacinutrix sp. C3R15]|uniref:hypothetical protein n=1 Tax=Flavobacteriaceae TaxID=49546 RepID=UPI001C0945A9|nr:MULTISPECIES: hypothetical protein [Flavobacteriaceae]MBU2940329.1 hypothetical protein [Lacinutrix sp. C3R15]MDO6623649.1 hypothetical protein [Oceanihabitans sp. 1_MG-2023]